MSIVAKFYSEIAKDVLRCELCPHFCNIAVNKYGNCKVRKNENGKLISENYGKLCSIHLDPIEKKPLYHFYPSSKILSIGSVGCNFHCNFCQNSDISQTGVHNFFSLQNISIEQIIAQAATTPENIGIAYTYNEPVVWYEFMKDLAIAAKNNNLKNVMVSNGYINAKPLEEILPYMDAFNIDLKAFNNDFYKRIVGAQLEPVKQTLKQIKKSGNHLEITNLIIPTLNDNISEFETMVKWINDELGINTILHLSRYFPRYKSTIPATPESTMLRLYELAKKNLNFVYIGNMQSEHGQNTICPKCGKTLVYRHYYNTSIEGLNEKGLCKYCSYNNNFKI